MMRSGKILGRKPAENRGCQQDQVFPAPYFGCGGALTERGGTAAALPLSRRLVGSHRSSVSVRACVSRAIPRQYRTSMELYRSAIFANDRGIARKL